MKFFASLLLAFFLFFSISAQETLILQPGAATGKDAEIFSLQPSTTMVSDLFRANAWTFNGSEGIERGLIEFDLSSIPSGAVIDSAFLFLYSPEDPHSQFHSGDNEAELRRILTPWNEASVTWNNQPSTTGSGQVEVPAAELEYQDYKLDVTELVTDSRLEQGRSFGFMISLDSEDPFRRLGFVSSDYSNSARHPKLIVHYTPPICTSIVLQPGAEGKDAEVFSLQPNTPLVTDLFRGNTWTFGGQAGVERGLIEFDLTSVPSDADLTFAFLTLYAPDAPHSQFHSGENSAVLQRIVEDWEENTVTWNNQPSTTSENEVLLEEAVYDYENYINIDVTEIVSDMLEDPSGSFGFMLSLQNEDIFRRLAFVSGDYVNAERHPKLEVCYTSTVSTDHEEKGHAINIYPNPFSGSFTIEGLNNNEPFSMKLFDLTGRFISDDLIIQGSPIDKSALAPSVYIMKILDGKGQQIAASKLVRQ